jgi:hypothetical protein
MKGGGGRVGGGGPVQDMMPMTIPIMKLHRNGQSAERITRKSNRVTRTIYCESEEVIQEMIPTRKAEKQRRVGRLKKGKER